MARLEGSPELVVLVSKDNANHPAELARYTTRGMLRVEERMAEIAFEMAAADRHRVRDAAFRSALSEHPQLSHEQREAFRQTISARDIEAVAGFAGSGKSAAVAAAKDAWEASGYRVSGGALSGIAAENLEKSSGLERSGRAMALIGLRMMPTFPSPSLRFRTAGFPRYGSKAGCQSVPSQGKGSITSPPWFASDLRVVSRCSFVLARS